MTYQKYQTPNRERQISDRKIAHSAPQTFRPQIISPIPDCRPQISSLAPCSKSQGVTPWELIQDLITWKDHSFER